MIYLNFFYNILTYRQRAVAFQFNILAETLGKLNMTKEVKAVSYDLNFNGYPDTIEY